MSRRQKLSRYAKTLLRQCPIDHFEPLPTKRSNPILRTLEKRGLIEVKYELNHQAWDWCQRLMTVEEATIALLDVLPNTAKTLDAHPACEEIKRLRRLMGVE